MRLGFLHYDSGELVEAAQAFEMCGQVKPDSIDAWLNLAMTYWSAGERDKAKEAFKRALALDSDSALARRGLAGLAIEAGDAGEAAQYSGGLLPESWDVVYNLAVLQQANGSLGEAAGLYREVVGVKPEFAEAWLNLGNVLFSLGDLKESKECWKSALERQPQLSKQFLFS
jgi:tetratricopeptide (TPR) repeat protein